MRPKKGILCRVADLRNHQLDLIMDPPNFSNLYTCVVLIFPTARILPCGFSLLLLTLTRTRGKARIYCLGAITPSHGQRCSAILKWVSGSYAASGVQGQSPRSGAGAPTETESNVSNTALWIWQFDLLLLSDISFITAYLSYLCRNWTVEQIY